MLSQKKAHELGFKDEMESNFKMMFYYAKKVMVACDENNKHYPIAKMVVEGVK